MLVGNKFSPLCRLFCFSRMNLKFHSVCLQLNGATYKSATKFAGGGVGRNIAEGLQKLNGAVALISAFGNDQNGAFLRNTLPERATAGSFVSDTSPTANCAVILDKDGDFKLAVGDMTIHKEITPDLVSRFVLFCAFRGIFSSFSGFFLSLRSAKTFRFLSARHSSVSIRTSRSKPLRQRCCWLQSSENQVRSSLDFS